VKKCCFFAVVLLLAGTAWADPPQEVHRYVAQVLRRSTYVFSATVVHQHDTTVAATPANAQTMVVHVTHEFIKPDHLPSYAGKDITVEIRPSLPLRKKAVFFTTGWLVGESIAVRELGHVTGYTDDDMAGIITKAEQLRDFSRLDDRIRLADSIVAGAVGQSAEFRTERRARSEHDPEWRKAGLQVQAVLKANAAHGPSAFLFPSSHDVAWIDAPRLKGGETGIFFLHWRKQLGEYVVETKQDIVDLKELETVKAEIKKLQRSKPQ